MITICTRWELSQMPAELEWRMWRQLRGAFEINRFAIAPIVPEMQQTSRLDQYATMEEALASCPGKKVFLEPNGGLQITDLKHWHKWKTADGHDLILVLGNTARGNLDLVEEGDYAVRIKTPKPTHLYGISAAAIALAYWVGQ